MDSDVREDYNATERQIIQDTIERDKLVVKRVMFRCSKYRSG